SIVDRMVGAPERLVFEGPPVLVPPLKQDSRHPIAIEGDVLDTLATCPPLTLVEQARLEDLKARERHRIPPQVATLRPKFSAARAEDLVKRTGVSMQAAKQTVERWCEGILLPDIALPFDDPQLAGCTVGDVLADPDRFEGATLADPLEGIEYGRCVAKV